MITNSELKYIKKLGRKKYRNRYSHFVVEGEKVFNDFIESKIPIYKSYTTKGSKGKKNVLVTEYKGLRDPIFLLRKIFDFSGIKTDEITIPSLGEATDVTHFRKGLEKEFLEVFSSSHLRRCNQIAPTDIYKRFGWL